MLSWVFTCGLNVIDHSFLRGELDYRTSCGWQSARRKEAQECRCCCWCCWCWTRQSWQSTSERAGHRNIQWHQLLRHVRRRLWRRRQHDGVGRRRLGRLLLSAPVCVLCSLTLFSLPLASQARYQISSRRLFKPKRIHSSRKRETVDVHSSCGCKAQFATVQVDASLVALPCVSVTGCIHLLPGQIDRDAQ